MLRTNRCLLAKPQERDCEGLRELYTDPEVRKYLGGPADAAALEKSIAARLSSDSDRYWVIRHAPSDAFIGCVSLDTYYDGVSAEVSYQILPQWWGQGIGTEVVQRVIQHALEDLGLPNVLAETQTANKASCRLLEKVGMRLVETVRRYGAQQSVYAVANPA